ncbi:hypothetical protein HQ544_01820 [Candidatus Falkowbacteria bacterium]|nr:hypothetical protein [Candidatus Falkowbacteria bacterium]
MTDEYRTQLLEDVSWHQNHYDQEFWPTSADYAFLAATAGVVADDKSLSWWGNLLATKGLSFFRRQQYFLAGLHLLRSALESP